MGAKSADPRDRIEFFLAAPQSCLVLGQDLRVRDVNYEFTLTTGWTPGDILNKPLGGIVDGPAIAALRSISTAPDWRRVDHVQAAVLCKDGRSIPFELTVRALPERQKLFCQGSPPARMLRSDAIAPLVSLKDRLTGVPEWTRRQSPIRP